MASTEYTARAVINEDRECIRCGYNLRGLTADKVCPECATPIAQSLRGNLLKHSDPVWLEKVRFGIALKLWNVALTIFVSMAAGCLVALFAGMPRIVFEAVGWIAGALGLWASFAITTQEPRIALQEDTVTLRKIIRASAMVGFLGGLIKNAGQGGVMPAGGAPMTVVWVLLGTLLGLAGLVAMFGELLYFRRFAFRIPDVKLAKSTTIVMWAAPITMGLVAIGGVLAAVFVGPTMGVTVGGAGTPLAPGTPTPPIPGMMIGVGVCFFLLVGVVLLAWYLRLLVGYGHHFNQAAEEARRSTASVVTASPSPTALAPDAAELGDKPADSHESSDPTSE